MKTRIVKLKTTCYSRRLPATSLAHLSARVGNNKDCSVQIRKITNVPANIKDWQVVKVWQDTVDISWLGGRKGRMSLKFSEIGAGRIVRNTTNK